MSYITQDDYYTSLSDFSEAIFFSNKIIYKPNRNMMEPWPASPNITPNRNGNVAQVYSAVTMKQVFRMLTFSYIAHVDPLHNQY